MTDAEQLVNGLLETEDLDWSADPNDPDSKLPEFEFPHFIVGGHRRVGITQEEAVALEKAGLIYKDPEYSPRPDDPYYVDNYHDWPDVMDALDKLSQLREAEEPEKPLDWSPDPEAPNMSQAFDAAAEALAAQELRKEFKRAFRNAFQQPEIDECDYFLVTVRNWDTHVVPAFVHDPGPVPQNPEGFLPSDAPMYAELEEVYLDYVSGFQDYVEGKPETVERRHGFVYRTSAPGYLDSSEWGAADTEEEAMRELIDYYGDAFDDDDGGEEPDDEQ